MNFRFFQVLRTSIRARLQLNLLVLIALSASWVPTSALASEIAINPELYTKRIEHDIQSFRDGHNHTFRSQGHPKADGVNLVITYPASWVAKESERPHIVQKFLKPATKDSPDTAMAMILMQTIPTSEHISEQERRSSLTPKGLRDFVPDGAHLLSAESTTIENIPAGIVEYEMAGERLGIQLLQHYWCVVFITGQHIISTQFSVGGASNESSESLSRRMTAYKPLFLLMANSITLPDQPAYEPTPNNGIEPYSGYWFLAVLVSLVITWGVGLTPAIVTRYIIISHPLSRKKATYLAIGFSAFCHFLFAGIYIALGEKPSNGAVWFIMFFVSRWIMTNDGSTNSVAIISKSDNGKIDQNGSSL